jgi:hypothetical protein
MSRDDVGQPFRARRPAAPARRPSHHRLYPLPLISTPFPAQVTVTLHPDLVPLVETGLILEGTMIHVVRAIAAQDASTGVVRRRIGVIVTQMRILDLPDAEAKNASVASAALTAAAAFRWVPHCVSDDRPAFTGRLNYISPDADDLMSMVPTWSKYARKQLFRASLVLSKNMFGWRYGMAGSGAASASGSGAAAGAGAGAGARSSSGAGAGAQGAYDMEDDPIITATQFAATGALPIEGAPVGAVVVGGSDPEGPFTLNYPLDRPSMLDVLTAQLLPAMEKRKTAREMSHYVRSIMPRLLQSAAEDDLNGLAPDILQVWDAARATNASVPGILSAIAAAYDAQLPLIGRVLAIGKLMHFGTPTANNSVPFRFEFRLADASQAVVVTCWNGAAVRFHQALTAAGLGALVAVHNYRVKQTGSRVEVSVNALGPAGLIFHLGEETASSFPPGRFPAVPLRFTPAADLFMLPQGQGCSVAGIITRVGPVCRTPRFDNDVVVAAAMTSTNMAGEDASATKTALTAALRVAGADVDAGAGAGAGAGASSSSSSGSGSSTARPTRALRRLLASSGQLGVGFGRNVLFLYRWIWVRDETSSREVAIKLYSNSKGQAMGPDLAVGVPVVVTHARVIATPRPAVPEGLTDRGKQDLFESRPVFLTSTEYTMALAACFDDDAIAVDALAAVHPRVKAVLDWFQGFFEAGALPFAPSPRGCILLPQTRTWAGTPSLVRPPTLDAYIGMMVRGAVGAGGGGVSANGAGAGAGGGGGASIFGAIPLLRPHEVDTLRRGHLDLARAVLQANARALGTPDATLLADMTQDGTSGPASILALAREAVALAKLQALRVVVLGRVAAVSTTTQDPVKEKGKAKQKGKEKEKEKEKEKPKSTGLSKKAAAEAARKGAGAGSATDEEDEDEEDEEEEEEEERGGAKGKGTRARPPPSSPMAGRTRNALAMSKRTRAALARMPARAAPVNAKTARRGASEPRSSAVSGRSTAASKMGGAASTSTARQAGVKRGRSEEARGKGARRNDDMDEDEEDEDDENRSVQSAATVEVELETPAPLAVKTRRMLEKEAAERKAKGKAAGTAKSNAAPAAKSAATAAGAKSATTAKGKGKEKEKEKGKGKGGSQSTAAAASKASGPVGAGGGAAKPRAGPAVAGAPATLEKESYTMSELASELHEVLDEPADDDGRSYAPSVDVEAAYEARREARVAAAAKELRDKAAAAKRQKQAPQTKKPASGKPAAKGAGAGAGGKRPGGKRGGAAMDVDEEDDDDEDEETLAATQEVKTPGAVAADEDEDAPLPTPLLVMTIADPAVPSDRTRVLLHGSSLLPHHPPLAPLPDPDPVVSFLREFFPPSAPRTDLDAFAQWIMDKEEGRTFAFCLLVHLRGFDAPEAAAPVTAGRAATGGGAGAGAGGGGAGAGAAAGAGAGKKKKVARDDDDMEVEDGAGVLATGPPSSSARLRQAIVRVEAIYEVREDGTAV